MTELLSLCFGGMYFLAEGIQAKVMRLCIRVEEWMNDSIVRIFSITGLVWLHIRISNSSRRSRESRRYCQKKRRKEVSTLSAVWVLFNKWILNFIAHLHNSKMCSLSGGVILSTHSRRSTCRMLLLPLTCVILFLLCTSRLFLNHVIFCSFDKNEQSVEIHGVTSCENRENNRLLCLFAPTRWIWL